MSPDKPVIVFFRNYSPIDVTGKVEAAVIAERDGIRFCLVMSNGSDRPVKTWLVLSPIRPMPKFLRRLQPKDRRDIFGNFWVGNFSKSEKYGAVWAHVDTKLQGVVTHEEKAKVFRVLHDKLNFTKD